MFVSLIIPAYNEEQRLARTLDLYLDAFRHAYHDDFEVVVVANGCVDRTVDIALDIKRRDPHVEVLPIAEAVGKGGAILAGIAAVRGERIVFADADAAAAPQSLIELVEHIDDYDVVIGSRRLQASTITRKQPLQRRVLGWAFAQAARLLFRLPFRDTQCGAKAFHRSAAQYLAGRVEERRWAFDIDLLRQAHAAQFRILEHPITWEDRDGSRLNIWPTLVQIIQSFWNMSRRSTADAGRHMAQVPHDA